MDIELREQIARDLRLVLKQDGITLAQRHFENNHNFYVDMRTAVQADVELCKDYSIECSRL